MSDRTDSESGDGDGSRSAPVTDDGDSALEFDADATDETETGTGTAVSEPSDAGAQPSEPTATDADEPADAVTMSFGDGETAQPESQSESSDDDLRYKTTPMLRPVLVLLGSVLVGGSIALSIPLLRPELFGDRALADIVLYAIAVLVTVTVVRLAVRLVVLWRTEYEIRDDALVRRYHLAYKRTVRKIPVSKLRGHEFAQSRYQASLGVGTIRLLTAGTNRSLGFLAFEHLKDPDTVRDEIQTLLSERADRAED